MPNPNFSLKITLSEANTIKNALEFYMKELTDTTTDDMDEQSYREEAGRIEKMLRIDF